LILNSRTVRSSTILDRAYLAKRGRLVSLSVTLIEVIREFNRAVPFQPYEIRTNGGERLRVPHPDFVMVAPRGTWGIVTDEHDRPRHIRSLLIEEVAPLTKRSTARRTKKSR
jgi:hypothetical protein